MRPPPPPVMTCGFPIQLVFCKKKTIWFIGVEVEQETSAPPLKKILDPPLSMMIHLTLPTHDNVGTCRHIDHGNQVYVFRWRVT